MAKTLPELLVAVLMSDPAFAAEFRRALAKNARKSEAQLEAEWNFLKTYLAREGEDVGDVLAFLDAEQEGPSS
jgi:hypothetical protein